MPARDLILTGVPRSGTTLCCHLINRMPDAVALFEPMAAMELPRFDRSAATASVGAYFRRARERLLASGEAESFHVDGHIPDNPAGPARQWQVAHGAVHFDKPLSAEFVLAIKHNAAFTALLPELAEVAPMFAVVRNPLAVLASWQSLRLPVSDGALPAGTRLDPVLAETLSAETEVLTRQLLILDWFFERYRRHLRPERILRYEDIVADPQTGFYDKLELPRSAIAVLDSRNTNPDYPRARIASLAEHLLERDGAFWSFYSRESVARLRDRMLSDPRP